MNFSIKCVLCVLSLNFLSSGQAAFSCTPCTQTDLLESFKEQQSMTTGLEGAVVVVTVQKVLEIDDKTLKADQPEIDDNQIRRFRKVYDVTVNSTLEGSVPGTRMTLQAASSDCLSYSAKEGEQHLLFINYRPDKMLGHITQGGCGKGGLKLTAGKVFWKSKRLEPQKFYEMLLKEQTKH